MQLVPSPLSTHPPVLPNWQLSGNSRPGFERKNPALYPGHEVWNSTTAIGMRAGLFLNGVRQSELARYYDSRTGTFCSADPLAGDPSDPQSWNRYPYGRNDPIDMTDPTGQHWWDWLALGGALVGDYFTFGALTGALAAEFPSGIQIGIDAASAAASAAGTGIAADKAIESTWGNAMNESLGMPAGWSPAGGISPYAGIDSLNQALGLPSVGGPMINNLTQAADSSCGLSGSCIDWKQLAQTMAMFRRMYPRPTVCGTKKMLVTGYDNSYQSTQKNPGDPGYGITTAGTVAAPGTIAAPRNYPLRTTQMNVPGYGWGTVFDRGGAIKNSHIDVWFPTTQQATNWGAQHLNVTVCTK